MSDYIDVVSPAKINLFLDVLGKREDGYHQVELIMQSLDLKDNINISVNKFQDEDIKIYSNNQNVPTGEGNLAYRAARLMTEGYYIPPLKIYLEKKIPIEAGLAGGSSNGAAVLWGLNELFNFNLSLDRLCELGKELGADVPFCLRGGTMLATGFGEELTRLPSMPWCYLLLVKPSFGVSTAKVYKALNKDSYDPLKYNDLLMSGKLIKALEQKSLEKISDNLYNSMEPTVKSWFGQVEDIIQMLTQNGALASLMSGSGPTIYGIFKDKKQAQIVEKLLKNWGSDIQVFVTTPRYMGVGKE
ncbi:4-(cytidine 5'-diphospho)-2-C-methyl-D-erythritol kinase [Natranaerofaba carboxydovora]|uniref:4-(cytidine 5'-diphospho)-2-C-methyl-D-erythritol kinase n=1 Tax=Natranaerofaba carboxydovora TaxID=2742683 RepID=UPI001F1438FD|nr:4-(cytidine 5'-diphospho)-2-C-methyl-D-erythritol kinase [Natranaerofaba carboxydovora]UMZ75264.1 4-diphosphocytidyl-2-C-methyl-D-erythritol kinase [Natranaerofaba carboxydovora]